MKLDLNDSEVIGILSLIDEDLNNETQDPMIKAMWKNILDKINNNIEFKHHNTTDEFVVGLIDVYYNEEGE
jgi:hypothetical protein